jgi:nucleoside-diphosphate-sugar epimerase
MSKKILVIGGTGAQGSRVAKALLASGYSIRVLSRDPDSQYVKEVFDEFNVELVKGQYDPTDCEQGLTNPGSWMDETAVEQALEGCYGAFVNTDSKQSQDTPVAYSRLP